MSRQDVLFNFDGEAIKVRARNLAEKSVLAIGHAVMSDAKILCAVDYGYLAASIMVSTDEKQEGFESPAQYSDKVPPASHDKSSFKKIDKPGEANVAHVGTAVDYGPYVEFGTARSRAQPFLRPALDMARGRVPAIVQYEGRLEFGEYLQ